MEPWCDVWLMDEPLAYQPAHGPQISFKIFYSPDLYDYVNSDLEIEWGEIMQTSDYHCYFGFGNNWYFSWLSCVAPNGLCASSSYSSVTLLAPGGGMRTYTNFDGTVPEFSTNTRLLAETNSGGDTVGFILIYPSGAEDVYETVGVDSGLTGSSPPFFLTKQVDAYGWATTFVYTNTFDSYGNADSLLLLQYVIDGDGKTNTITYTNITYVQDSACDQGDCAPIYFTNFISQITDPYGHTVTFNYNPTNDLWNGGNQNGMLTNIIDVAGISSLFAYDSSLNVTQLTTPYGPTVFYKKNFDDNRRLTVVTEPNGSHQMFCYYNEVLTYVPLVYTNTSNVPTNRPADNAQGTNTLDNPDWNNPDADDKMRRPTVFTGDGSSLTISPPNFWRPPPIGANSVDHQ